MTYLYVWMTNERSDHWILESPHGYPGRRACRGLLPNPGQGQIIRTPAENPTAAGSGGADY